MAHNKNSDAWATEEQISYVPNSQSPPPPPGWIPPQIQNDVEAALPDQGLEKAKLVFTEASIRAAFIKKVFALVTLMLLLVVVQVSLAVFVPSITAFMSTDPSLIIMACLTVVFLVLYIVLICVEKLRRAFPLNVILAFTLAFCLGYMVAVLCSYIEKESVFICTALLIVSCGSITIFSMQTRFNMTSCYGAIILLSIYLFWISIMSFGFIFWYDIEYYYVLYGVVACTLFMIYLAIDIQLIMGGGRKFAISPEEYVFAAVQIFVDVVYIFIYLIQIFARVK